jgi:hypothetical protein
VAAAAAANGGHVASSLRGDEAVGDCGAASSSQPPVPPGFVVVMAIFLWFTDKTLEFLMYDLLLGWKK